MRHITDKKNFALRVSGFMNKIFSFSMHFKNILFGEAPSQQNATTLKPQYCSRFTASQTNGNSSSAVTPFVAKWSGAL